MSSVDVERPRRMNPPTRPETPPPQGGVVRSRGAWLLPLIVAVIAFVVRWQSVQHSGGLHALLGYDEGVYFGASTSLVSGLLPYRDFVLVHPPGSLVWLSPFALLGKMADNSTGWAAARIFIMALGAFNAAMVFVIARRVSLVAAVVAGGLYALWGRSCTSSARRCSRRSY